MGRLARHRSPGFTSEAAMRLHAPSPQSLALCAALTILGAGITYLALYLYP